MYLKRVYRHSKLLFVFVVLFMSGQLFVNIKGGAAVSPFYHYGMFAAISKIQDEYNLVSVWVNDSLLQSRHFTPQQWDNIFYPVFLFDYQKKANIHQWRTDIRRLTHAQDSSLFINALTEEQFREWYHRKLSADLNIAIDSVRMTIEPYTYRNNRLQKKTSTPIHP